MEIKSTGIDGLFLIEPQVFRDDRGFFLESYQAQRYHDAGMNVDLIQDNHSRSKKGVLRGLHFQVKYPQAQIVYVPRGRIFDVVVDLRPWSATFKRWFGAELSDECPRQLYMAGGFAHGFLVLSDVADVCYKVSRVYDSSDEGGLLWCDPDIGIKWPTTKPNVSSRDALFPRINQIPETKLPHKTSETN